MLATVVAKAMHELNIKSQSSVLLHLARWVTTQNLEAYVDRLVTFHSAEVNPNELAVNAAVYGEVALLPKDARDFKTDLIMLAYNPKGKIEKVRPQPDIADFIKATT